jgi:hypothetical protein
MSVSLVSNDESTGLGPEQFPLLLGFFISCPPYPRFRLGAVLLKS